jgi:hypothetical protein
MYTMRSFVVRSELFARFASCDGQLGPQLELQTLAMRQLLVWIGQTMGDASIAEASSVSSQSQSEPASRRMVDLFVGIGLPLSEDTLSASQNEESPVQLTHAASPVELVLAASRILSSIENTAHLVSAARM